MTKNAVLIEGSGHLAYRTKKLSSANGHETIHLAHDALRAQGGDDSTFDALTHGLRDVDLQSLSAIYLVADRDERNLELLIVLVSLDKTLPIVASFFNENIAPHLQAAHPNIRILNPAKIAAPACMAALHTPLQPRSATCPRNCRTIRRRSGPIA